MVLMLLFVKLSPSSTEHSWTEIDILSSYQASDLEIILGCLGTGQMSKYILRQYGTYTHYIDQIKTILQKLSDNMQKILENLQNILLNLQKYQRISAENLILNNGP